MYASGTKKGTPNRRCTIICGRDIRESLKRDLNRKVARWLRCAAMAHAGSLIFTW
jgi:hypothetical protein